MIDSDNFKYNLLGTSDLYVFMAIPCNDQELELTAFLPSCVYDYTEYANKEYIGYIYYDTNPSGIYHFEIYPIEGKGNYLFFGWEN